MKKSQITVRIVMIFACILIVSMMPRCGKKEEHTEKKAKGRYIEEAVELPVKEGEEGVSLIKLSDNSFQLYTYNEKEKEFRVYDSADGRSYKEGNAGWLNDTLKGKECYMKDIAFGEDGGEYALYYQDEEMHLLKKTEDEKGEEILPDLIRPMIEADMVRASKDGNIILSCGSKGEINVYSKEDGSRMKSMNQGACMSSDSKVFDYQDGKALVLNKSTDGFCFYDVEKEEQVNEIKYQDIGDESGILRIGSKADGYYLNSKGLHHMNMDGSAVETLIDGDTAAMGDITMSARGLEQGEDKDYFILYNTKDGNVVLNHYTYDKDASAVPDDQLTIYGLEESATITQAISRFQKEHPDVKVNYRIGTQEEASTTKADQIRVLNTELLSGNGADILVLDGLPAKSYIEKGVLEDMTDFYKEMEEKNFLLNNVVSGMKEEKHLYGMPARVKVLGIYGSQKEVKAMDSLDDLEKYLDSSSEDKLLGTVSYECYLKLLMKINYKELFQDNKNEAVSEEGLEKLLRTTKKLGEAAGSDAYTTMEYYLKRMPGETEESIKKTMGSDILEGISTRNDLDARKKNQAVIVEAKGISDLMVPCSVIGELGTKAFGIHNLYLPKAVVGVNKSSENKELAKEFLAFLFSEEIQSLDLGDGFPVNENALDSWCGREKNENGESIMMSGGEDGTEFSAEEPSGRELKQFADIEKEADTPIQIDEAVMEMIVDEGTAYFKGEKSLEDAIKNITNKAETYLAE